MRRLIISIVIMLCVAGSTFGQIVDFIKWNTLQHPYLACYPADLDFLITYQCSTPSGNLMGLSLGFEITVFGPLTFAYDSCTFHHEDDWFDAGIFIDDTQMPDAFYIQGAALPGSGVPRVTNEPFFTLHVHFNLNDVGLICIDSAFFPPTGTWQFSGTNCDPTGGPRPYFIDRYGSDEYHPICADVIDWLGTPPTITIMPDNDALSGGHCNVLTFDFAADPGGLPGYPNLPLRWEVLSGPGWFSDSTYYVGPLDAGTYAVEIVFVTTDCAPDYYSFTVVLTNQPPQIANAGSQPSKAYVGHTYWWDFDVSDPDTCDVLTWSVTSPDSPVNMPTIDDSGYLQWQTDEDDSGTYQICVTVDDGQSARDATPYCFDVEVLHMAPVCGDVDGSGEVDIDDVVYTLSYIFAGGPQPILPEVGNPDCAGGTDIDDVVYLIAYIFSGGAPPCDPNNDTIPDC